MSNFTSSAVASNYFSLFGLPENYAIELERLHIHYRELQKRFHPDRFAAACERDRLLAMQQAANINDAFETLKSPILRGEYLLVVRGLDMACEHTTLQDTAFLMQQMELREQLEEIAGAGDPEVELSKFSQEITASSQQLIAQLTDILDKKWTVGATESLQQAFELIQKLKFYHKLSIELEQLEEKLLDF